LLSDQFRDAVRSGSAPRPPSPEMIVASNRTPQEQWMATHGMPQQRPPEKSGEGQTPKSVTEKHRIRHCADAYQHDEVLAGFLASLHRKPVKRSAEKILPTPREQARDPLPERERLSEAPKESKLKPKVKHLQIDTSSSEDQSFLELATDDDAVAISCLQHLSRSIPKLEPERKPAPELISSPNRRTRVPMACTRCKMAHTRCDTKRPCGRCVRRGVADSCVDAIPKRRGRKRSEDMEAPIHRSIRPRIASIQPHPSKSHTGQGYSRSPNSDSVSHSWSSQDSTPEEDFQTQQRSTYDAY